MADIVTIVLSTFDQLVSGLAIGVGVGIGMWLSGIRMTVATLERKDAGHD